MAAAAKACGRENEHIELTAVSKFFPIEAIEDVYQAGQRIFGESRAQELRDKIPLLPSDIQWHFIGPLQSNKLRYLIPSCQLIHALDSRSIAEALQKYSKKKQHISRVLVEINSSGEASKHGFPTDQAMDAILEICDLPDIDVVGLMTIGPHTDDIQAISRAFSTTRQLMEEANKHLGQARLNTLSMGMSADFEIAIREGSTMVRVGSAIFGQRRS